MGRRWMLYAGAAVIVSMFAPVLERHHLIIAGGIVLALAVLDFVQSRGSSDR